MAISPSPQVPDLGLRNRESGHSGITQHTPSELPRLNPVTKSDGSRTFADSRLG